jgi:hypothetical protein
MTDEAVSGDAHGCKFRLGNRIELFTLQSAVDCLFQLNSSSLSEDELNRARDALGQAHDVVRCCVHFSEDGVDDNNQQEAVFGAHIVPATEDAEYIALRDELARASLAVQQQSSSLLHQGHDLHQLYSKIFELVACCQGRQRTALETPGAMGEPEAGSNVLMRDFQQLRHTIVADLEKLRSWKRDREERTKPKKASLLPDLC